MSPVDGVVSARLVEPGTTVVAGQAVVQIIDPATLWVRARIDQGQSGGLRVGQPAEIVLRSDAKRAYRGEVQRVDWVSDAVTEERIVNVGFATRPEGISVGELVEVTIRVAELANTRSVPAAAVKRVDRQDGVWLFNDGRVTFRQAKVGITTLDGRSQILDGLADGDEVVVHSEQALKPDARVKVVNAIIRSAP
jgi:HlyD family secretion protein